MVRTPAEGTLTGYFYFVQFKALKSTSAHYRDRWSFYSTDVVPLTEEQSQCWQKFGSYGFFTEKSGLTYLKKIRDLAKKNSEKGDYVFRLAKVSFLLSTEGI